MVQTWPDEDFAVLNTPFNGVGADLYVSAEPFASNPEATTGFSLSTAQGTPFDGYQAEVGAREGRCSVARNASDGADGDLVVCVTRAGFDEDTIVSGFPSYEIRSGAPDGTTFKGWGVCSHVGATYTGAADPGDSYLSGLSGYFLLEVKASSLAQTILLLEVSSGTITEIASERVRDVDPAYATLSAAEYAPPRPLSLLTQKSGTTITLTATRTNLSGARVTLFGGAQVQSGALSYGGAGFVVQSAKSTTPATLAGLIERFFVGDDSGTTLLDDEFLRTNRFAARSLSDALVTGRSLASAWIGDDETYTDADNPGGTLRSQVEIQSSSESAYVAEDPSDGTTFSGFHLWQNPVIDPNQRYSAKLKRRNVDTTTTVEFGLALRFTVVPFPTGILEARGRIPVGAENVRTGTYKIGYTATVKYESGPTWTLELRHYGAVLTGGTTYQAPVIATADLTSFSLAVGASFTLEVGATSFDGDNFGVGSFVAIDAEIDGTPITNWVAGGAAGVGLVDDYVVDTRSIATAVGPGVGLVVIPDDLGSGALVEFDTFQAATGNGGSNVPPNDQASIAVDSEVTSKSGSLTTPLSALVTETSATRPIEHVFESGLRQRIISQPADRESFDVSGAFTAGERDQIVDLHRANGTSIPFDWTHYRTGESVAVRFASSEIAFEVAHLQGAAAVYRAAFRLERVFPAATYNA